VASYEGFRYLWMSRDQCCSRPLTRGGTPLVLGSRWFAQGGIITNGADGTFTTIAPTAVWGADYTLGVVKMSDDDLKIWARETLSSVGFLWGSDLGDKLAPALAKRVADLVPRPNRWWWHVGSTLFFVAALIPELQVLQGAAVLPWLASLCGHSYVARKNYLTRKSEREAFQQQLYEALETELDRARSDHLGPGPFGHGDTPPPTPQLLGVSHEGAEHLCAEWLAYLGEQQVVVTRAQNDGGIDILSSRCVAQVKNYQGSVGVTAIRELVGAASVDGRYPIFFTSGTYTKSAIGFADQAGVYLFRYDAAGGTLDGANPLARGVLEKAEGITGVQSAAYQSAEVFTNLDEMAAKIELLRQLGNWVALDPARVFLPNLSELWEKLMEPAYKIFGLDWQLLSQNGPDGPHREFAPLWADIEAAADEFSSSLGVHLPIGDNFSIDGWAKIIEDETASDGHDRVLNDRPVYELIEAEDKVQWWREQRSSLILIGWFSTTLSQADDAREANSVEPEAFWGELVGMRPEVQRWITEAESGRAELSRGRILQAKQKGLIVAWAEEHHLPISGLFPEESMSRLPEQVNHDRPAASGQRFPAPAHCPICDYAPAPEEKTCSECGYDFSDNGNADKTQ
jgi:hypothetical protein